jgi:hypothetical protein
MLHEDGLGWLYVASVPLTVLPEEGVAIRSSAAPENPPDASWKPLEHSHKILV